MNMQNPHPQISEFMHISSFKVFMFPAAFVGGRGRGSGCGGGEEVDVLGFVLASL